MRSLMGCTLDLDGIMGLMAPARPITREYIPGAVSNELDGVHARHTILSTSAPVCPVKDDRKADFQPNLNVPERHFG